MREWLWRTLANAGAASCGAPWMFMPADTQRPSTEPFCVRPEANVSLAFVHPGERRQKGNEPGIGRECEAFLAGRYYELFSRTHRKGLPGWVWINPLAHCGRTELKRLANSSFSHHDPLAFLSYLADEVLLCVRDDLMLETIQHDTLVPLEFGLLHLATAEDPTVLARVVRDQLRRPIG